MSIELILGGARSGKSAYAESLCLGLDGPRDDDHCERV